MGQLMNSREMRLAAISIKMIEQARAEKEAALLRAEAIAIIGQAAKDFPEYRTQEFMGAFAEAVQNGAINQIIYVPTEANVPIVRTQEKADASSR